MAYCRFDEDSDVYVYVNIGGVFICCSCKLMGDYEDYCLFPAHTTNLPSMMLQHLINHKEKGHKVPQYALTALEEDSESFNETQ